MNVRPAIAALLLLSPLVGCVPEGGSPTTPTTTTPDAWSAAAGCYTYLGFVDILFTGSKNTFGNAAYHDSTDGSCTGPLVAGPGATNTFVEAIDNATADALCNALDPGPTTYNAAEISTYLAPVFPVAGAWSCVV